MASPLRGVYSAMCTPFTADGSDIDEAGLRDLVDGTIAAGIHGLIPCGSTGEFASMNTEERMRVTEIVMDQTRERVPVVPHTGSSSLREAVKLSQHAERLGVAGVMVVFPFYEPISLDEVYDYYRAVSDAVSIPIMVYNSPSGTGKNLPSSFIARLGREIANVKYLKDSSASMPQIHQLVYRHAAEIITFNGWDTMFYAGFEVGCQGAVCGPANVMPRQCAQIFDLVQAGKLDEARDLDKRIWPVMQFFEENRYNAAIKAGANLVGFRVGTVRPPFQPLAPEKVEELRQLLVAAEIIRPALSRA
ncbi:MAG: dihydrodipicolinate synthase family protein [Chloroflexi bacterium]|nr:dihydrodipicolinate synthase family protein [Chloroflexota bacterium]